ncbi:MAG: Flp family type IVb pilin [Nevskiaceae bacterium]|nr:MAG: Flp family type IVb pilin [Nevskiaceae bacterium]
MLQKIVKFVRDEEGASAVEYGLIVGLIAIAIVAVLILVGGGLSTLFGKVNTALSSAG